LGAVEKVRTVSLEVESFGLFTRTIDRLDDEEEDG